ncbi:MAG TPA: glycosyltransferase [Acidimicrobiia bacterium]|jgi:glycosyltransferase involved in cell wall biosynthesis
MSGEERVGPVLLVDLAKGFGGAEVRVVDTALLLAESVECSIVALEGTLLHRRAMAAGIPVHPLRYQRHDPRIVGAVRDLIRSHRYRVVDAHNVQSQLWGLLAAKAERLPGRVSTVHSEYRFENPGPKGRAHEQVLRRNLAWGASFVAVSEGIARYLRDVLGPQPQIELIRRAFPVPRPMAGAQIRRSDLGWDEQDFVVGVIGRLAIAKGHPVLFQALSILREKGVRLRCYIVGEGAERERLEREVRSSGLLDSVHFAGFREDVGSALDFIDLLCLPSLSEGLPNVALEAVVSQVPLVATSVGELPSLLRDGKDALLVPPNDPLALAAALERALASSERLSRLADSAYDTLAKALIGDWIAQTIEHYRRAQRSPL